MTVFSRLAFCVHPAVLAPTASALSFPAAFAVGVGIVQGLIFGTNHIVENFIVNIVISQGIAVFCLGRVCGRNLLL